MLDPETIEKWNETGEVISSDPIINIDTILRQGNRQNVAKQNQMYGNKQSQNPYITLRPQRVNWIQKQASAMAISVPWPNSVGWAEEESAQERT